MEPPRGKRVSDKGRGRGRGKGKGTEKEKGKGKAYDPFDVPDSEVRQAIDELQQAGPRKTIDERRQVGLPDRGKGDMQVIVLVSLTIVHRELLRFPEIPDGPFGIILLIEG
jgi:hypothetical protein